MRPSYVAPALVLITNFASPSSALRALTESPCAIQCGNTLGSTMGSEITCDDDDYGSAAAVTFQNCISCQLSSTYVDPSTNQTDVQWALYNLRYALSWCIWGFPDNIVQSSSQCDTSFSCGPLVNDMEDTLAGNATAYGYCDEKTSANYPKCTGCLSEQGGTAYLGNFVTALNGACEQKPAPGSIISLQGTLFSETLTNITAPSATPLPFVPSHGISLAAKVGIAIAAVVLLLVISGFCIICLGRRRRRKAIALHQRETGYAEWVSQQQSSQASPPQMSTTFNGAAFHDSPMSQRPLVSSQNWGQLSAREGDSPASAMGERNYFSPYSSQYSSPISAVDQLQIKSQEWPMDRKGSLGGSTTGVPDRPRSMEKRFFPDEEDGDRIELQNVPPVLLHPGQRRVIPAGLNNVNAGAGHGF